MKNRGTVEVILAGVLWGLINLFIKPLSALGLSTIQIALVRMVIAALCFGVFTAATNPSAFRIDIRDLWIFIGTGCISIVLFNYCYFYTIINGQASVAVVLLYTSPVFVMLMAALLFREKITGVKIIAAGLTLIGCVLVSGILTGSLEIPAKVFATGIASGFLYALYTIFGRYGLKKYSSTTVTVYSFILAAICLLAVADKTGLGQALSAGPKPLLLCAGLAVVSTILPYYLYTAGLEKTDSGRAAILVAVEPAVGAFLGITVFHEPVSFMKVAGILLVLIAILIMNRKK